MNSFGGNPILEYFPGCTIVQPTNLILAYLIQKRNREHALAFQILSADRWLGRAG
jgi:hypothetical protein